MKTAMQGVAALAAVLAMTLPAMADDAPAKEKQAQKPNPRAMFQRLDANGDRAISIDEVPESAPERVKALLKKADADGDQSVTPEEMGALWKKWQGRKPAPRGARGPSMAGRPGPGPAAAPWRPDPKVLFDRLDRDDDGALSPKEFGIAMHLMRAVGHRGLGPMGRPPMAGRGMAYAGRRGGGFRPGMPAMTTHAKRSRRGGAPQAWQGGKGPRGPKGRGPGGPAACPAGGPRGGECPKAEGFRPGPPMGGMGPGPRGDGRGFGPGMGMGPGPRGRGPGRGPGRGMGPGPRPGVDGPPEVEIDVELPEKPAE